MINITKCIAVSAAAIIITGCGNNSAGNGQTVAATIPNTQQDNRAAVVFSSMSGAVVYHIPSSGQSNSIGGGSSTPLTTTPQGCGTLYTLLGGTKLVSGASEPVFPTLGASIGESHITSMGVVFAAEAGLEAKHAVVLSSHGVAGKSIAQIGPKGPTGSYESIIASVKLLHSYASAAGANMQVPYVPFIHGEFDATSIEHPAYYGDALSAYATSLNKDIKAITKQTETVRLVQTQVAGGPYMYMLSNHIDSLWNIKQTQWKKGVTDDNIVIAGPLYNYPLASDPYQLHYSSISYQMVGEMLGKVMAYMTRTGKKWYPLYPEQLTLVNGAVEVTFHVPVPPLRWDESFVAVNKGFELFDSYGSVPLISVNIVDNKVVLVPGREIAGPPHVRYGYGFNSSTGQGGGSLTDTDNTLSPHGFTLRNWSVHFEI